jgi:hypothetical protein
MHSSDEILCEAHKTSNVFVCPSRREPTRVNKQYTYVGHSQEDGAYVYMCVKSINSICITIINNCI